MRSIHNLAVRLILVAVVTASFQGWAKAESKVSVEQREGFRLVTLTARASEMVSVPRAAARTPLVLEMGSAGRPERRVMPFMSHGKMFFRARPGVQYQVWELRKYVQSVADRAASVLGSLTGSQAQDKLRAAVARLRDATTDDRIALRLEVGRALAISEGLIWVVTADSPTDTPGEYRASSVRPVKITTAIYNQSAKSMEVRLARTVTPTDWPSTAKNPTGWVRLRPHQRKAWSFELTAPRRTYQGAAYPIIAWFEIRSGGPRWQVEDGCTLRVNKPKAKKTER